MDTNTTEELPRPDLRNVRVIVVVFAMPGCGACDDYLPKFMHAVRQHQRWGAPFHVWRPGLPIHPGTIPVLLYDAASPDPALQDFADRLQIEATPTTAVLGRRSVHKVEGSLGPMEIDNLLYVARRMA